MAFNTPNSYKEFGVFVYNGGENDTTRKVARYQKDINAYKVK